MKKLILLIAGAVGATLLKRKLDEQQAERALWAEATDTATGGPSHTTPPSAR
ncbi:MAG: DLW-39 family protein [Dermatophilaceae bacterium]